jgi:hypothetical protein
MTMEGMPAGMGMPATTRRTCTSKEWTKPPVSGDEHGCQTTDFHRTANGASWKVSCEGTTGEGEVTRTSPDAFKGSMKMSAPQGVMTMTFSGKRVGDCDAAEAQAERQAQIARVQAQRAAGEKAAADATKQACSMGTSALDLRTQKMYAQLCPGDAYDADFCAAVKSYDGFKKVCDRKDDDPENSMAALAKFCAADAGAMRRDGCGRAVETKDYMTIGKCCPAEAKPLAKEHCAGRAYTGMRLDDSWAAFCATFARTLLEGN